MIDLRPNNAKVGAYYTDCHSHEYIFVLSVDTDKFVFSWRNWDASDWSYPTVCDVKFADVDEVQGQYIKGPRHPGDVDSKPVEVKCECGANKAGLGRHSSWCPKG